MRVFSAYPPAGQAITELRSYTMRPVLRSASAAACSAIRSEKSSGWEQMSLFHSQICEEGNTGSKGNTICACIGFVLFMSKV